MWCLLVLSLIGSGAFGNPRFPRQSPTWGLGDLWGPSKVLSNSGPQGLYPSRPWQTPRPDTNWPRPNRGQPDPSIPDDDWSPSGREWPNSSTLEETWGPAKTNSNNPVPPVNEESDFDDSKTGWGPPVPFPTFAPSTTAPPLPSKTLSPLVQEVHLPPSGCSCPRTGQYNPVCGSDGRNYSNIQLLNCYIKCGTDVSLRYRGGCRRKVG